MLIAAIDAGNGRFKIAVLDSAGNPKLLMLSSGLPYFPAVVYFGKNGQKLIGIEAQNAALADPQRAVFGWKRMMGTDEILFTDDDGKTYKAVDILTLFLTECKKNIENKTGHVANDAVILTPANYNDKQTQQTIDAGAQAGMNVILTPHEPTCAALGNDIHKKGSCVALVSDLGSGTFDVSVVRSRGNLFEVIATGGVVKLGSSDFNKRAEEEILSEFEAKYGYRPTLEEHPIFHQHLFQQIEQIKISLSEQKECPLVVSCESDLLKTTVTRDQFESWISPLVDKTIQQTEQTLQEANMQWSDIGEICAVGGGSMTPIVRQKLEQASGKKISQKCEPYCAAALGGVIAARLEYDRQGKDCYVNGDKLPPPDFHMREIISRSIGVAVLDDNEQETCCVLLQKNTPIPSIQTRKFKMAEPNQTAVRINILDGDNGANISKCLQLGYFELKDLPARPDLIGRIEITFDLDANGMLSANARDIVSGKTEELTIDYKKASTTGNKQTANAKS